MAPNPVKNKTSPATEESDEKECPLAPRKRRRLRAHDDVDAAVFSCVSADRGPERLSADSQEAADLCDAKIQEDTNILHAAGARRGRELAKLKPDGTVVVAAVD
eukprot:g14179.t1